MSRKMEDLIFLKPADLENQEQDGLPTGIITLDAHLPWRGLPRSRLTSFIGPKGSGRLQAWALTAAKLKGWSAWIETENEIYPPALAQMGVDLHKLLIVRVSQEKKIMWALNQMIRSNIFELIGCEAHRGLHTSDVQKIERECRISGTSVVFFLEEVPPRFPHWLFKLQLNFSNPEMFIIEKARTALPAPVLVERTHGNPYSFVEHFKPPLSLGRCS